MKNILITVFVLLFSGLAAADPVDLEIVAKSSCRIMASNSAGSGTAIYEDSNYIYILTNAHVATTSNPTVEFFHNGYKTQPIPGKTIWRLVYNRTDIDFALIRVQKRSLSVQPEIVPLAPPGYTVKRGDYIASAGCPYARWLEIWEGHIISDDMTRIKFYPAPLDGQSGSGIFVNIDGNIYIVGIVTWRLGSRAGILDIINPSPEEAYGGAVTAEKLRKVLAGDVSPISFKTAATLLSTGLYALGADNKYYPQNQDGSVSVPPGTQILRWNVRPQQPWGGRLVPLPPGSQIQPRQTSPVPEEPAPTPVEPEAPTPQQKQPEANTPPNVPPEITDSWMKNNTKYQELVIKYEELQQQYNDLKAEYDSTLETYADLQIQIGQKDQEIQNLQIQINDFNEKLTEKDSQISELQIKIEATDSNIEQINNLTTIIEQQKTEITNLNQTITVLQTKIEENEAEEPDIEENVEEPQNYPDESESENDNIVEDNKEGKQDSTWTWENLDMDYIQGILLVLAGVLGALGLKPAKNVLIKLRDGIKSTPKVDPSNGSELIKYISELEKRVNTKFDAVSDVLAGMKNDDPVVNNINITNDNKDTNTDDAKINVGSGEKKFTNDEVSSRITQFFDLKKRQGESLEEWAIYALLYKEATELLRKGKFEISVNGNTVTLQGQKKAADKIDNWVREQFLKRMTVQKLDANYLYHEAMIGFLYREAVNKLRAGYFPVLGAAETAEAIEQWVRKEFMHRMGFN
jgi:hypothetical protein